MKQEELKHHYNSAYLNHFFLLFNHKGLFRSCWGKLLGSLGDADQVVPRENGYGKVEKILKGSLSIHEYYQ